ncbi:hypothetical protein PG997_007037 [Apiospora hydei]|uniref:Uncharacterized protein n=1 Tax=Apiospora hydei TaxID=1337664 RepID=A0ABR1WQE3_9PEZI
MCDNYEHPFLTGSDSTTRSYVCNCRGEVAIPAIYAGADKDKDVQGRGCGVGGSGDTDESKVGTSMLAAASTLDAAPPRARVRPGAPSSSRKFGIVTVAILLTRRWLRSV